VRCSATQRKVLTVERFIPEEAFAIANALLRVGTRAVGDIDVSSGNGARQSRFLSRP